METVLPDIRYGSRLLLKRPGFTAVTVLAVAQRVALRKSMRWPR